MKIGIVSNAYGYLGAEAGLFRLAEHGYRAVDFQDFTDTETDLFTESEAYFERTLRDYRSLTSSLGLEISQAHGPWRYPMRDGTEEDRAERFEKMAKSIRGTAMLGCKNFVIHNIMPTGGEDTDYARAIEMNREFFGRLLPVAEEYGVVICMENMPFLHQALATPLAMTEFVRSFDSPNMKICLDTGHSAVHGVQPAVAVHQIGGDLLACIHVHDNDGKADRHWLPCTGVTDWSAFGHALHEVGYAGVFSLETRAEAGNWDAEQSLFHLADRIANKQ